MGTPACGSLETYADDVARLYLSHPALHHIAAEIADFKGIAQVVDWMSLRSSGKPAIDLIGMDEFEFDFLLEVEPEGLWLAFGVT
jgi:hypothetical protein